jgi:hypothetical protein
MARGTQVRLNNDKRETILNQLIPAHRRIFDYAAWGVVLLALAHLCWLQLRPESEWHRFRVVAATFTTRRAAMKKHEPSDGIDWQASEGNAVLQLAGYAKTNPVVENTLSYIYYRASYDLYPRRIYVAPADKVVNNGLDILRIGFSPDPQWLQTHDVRSVLTYGNGNGGNDMLRLDVLPSSNGQAGRQSNPQGVN